MTAGDLLYGLHWLDIAVVGAYFAVVIGIGWWASRRIKSQEDYFMGGRAFGRITAIFMTFGMASSADSAVSAARETYRQGMAGVWVGLRNLFISPFYWIFSGWYRRLRMISTGDFLRTRFESRWLEMTYSIVALLYFTTLIALALVALHKTVSVMVPKDPSLYTAEETAQVEAFQALRSMEAIERAGALTAGQRPELMRLRRMHDAGQAVSPAAISHLNPYIFVPAMAAIVLVYGLAGGLLAAAKTDVLQGVLLLVLSVLLLPAALSAVGGFSGLHRAVPESMFSVFASDAASEYPWHYVVATIMLGLASAAGLPENYSCMGGAAKDDLSARVGATYGSYVKRTMMVLWGLAGIIGFALYRDEVGDADMIWGHMTLRLLGPGLVGLMIACLAAAVMSSADSFMVAAGALGARNLYGQMAPGATDRQKVVAGRVASFLVVALGVVLALTYRDMLDLMKRFWPIMTAAGPPALMAMLWRRTNKLAAWGVMVYALVVTIGIANVGENLDLIARSKYFTAATPSRSVTVRVGATEEDVRAGRAERPGQVTTKTRQLPPRPVFFEKLALDDPSDPNSPRRGRGRFRVSLLWLAMFGAPLRKMSFATLNSLGFVLDAVVPFVIVIACSYIGKPNSGEMLDRFYARLHTPACADPDEDARQVELSEREPTRFAHRKLFPGTQLEVLKPERQVWLGFLLAWVVTGTILAGMFGLCALTWP